MLYHSFKIIFVIGLWMICFNLLPQTEKQKEQVKENEKIMQYVEVMTINDVEKIELETYLIGVVASEMPYTFELEALKAQSVAARTYVLSRNLKVDASTNTQVYKNEAQLKEIYDENYETMYTKIKQAVEATKGEVLTYENEYISALFYSCNNGYSNDCSWYFENERPYLKCVQSKWDLAYENCKTMVEKSKQEVLSALQISSLDIVQYTHYDNGYVKTIQIGNKVFSGREVRELLNLRSSCFKFEDIGAYVRIYCEGYGHGVGMSQYGANGMAKEGFTYEEILKHYYTDVQLESIY